MPEQMSQIQWQERVESPLSEERNSFVQGKFSIFY
jgi:hypothetical protein